MISIDNGKDEIFFPQKDLHQAGVAIIAWEQERIHLEAVDPVHLDLEEDQVIDFLKKANLEKNDWNKRKNIYEAASVDHPQSDEYLTIAAACQQVAEKIVQVEELYGKS
ncbi:MAG: hypothetical protein K2W97_08115 [Chthoniobacterales bacterium]|nr:hypothetical protein [Chthoniobacterales bacterium]